MTFVGRVHTSHHPHEASLFNIWPENNNKICSYPVQPPVLISLWSVTLKVNVHILLWAASISSYLPKLQQTHSRSAISKLTELSWPKPSKHLYSKRRRQVGRPSIPPSIHPFQPLHLSFFNPQIHSSIYPINPSMCPTTYPIHLSIHLAIHLQSFLNYIQVTYIRSFCILSILTTIWTMSINYHWSGLKVCMGTTLARWTEPVVVYVEAYPDLNHGFKHCCNK